MCSLFLLDDSFLDRGTEEEEIPTKHRLNGAGVCRAPSPRGEPVSRGATYCHTRPLPLDRTFRSRASSWPRLCVLITSYVHLVYLEAGASLDAPTDAPRERTNAHGLPSPIGSVAVHIGTRCCSAAGTESFFNLARDKSAQALHGVKQSRGNSLSLP
ncbi:hypothetical protein F4861DRAFT_497260 [Xylaria intraflava]|nr:hypothetical protein F4861DRAFT_497260 [Xylaria intraflava]